MPGLWQLERSGLGKQALQGVLILGEVLDARPLATGKPMARQVAGNHREALLQRPFDHMPIEAGVVVEPVKDKQRRLHLLWPPDLADHFVTIDLKTTEGAANLTRGKIQSIKPLISLGLR